MVARLVLAERAATLVEYETAVCALRMFAFSYLRDGQCDIGAQRGDPDR